MTPGEVPDRQPARGANAGRFDNDLRRTRILNGREPRQSFLLINQFRGVRHSSNRRSCATNRPARVPVDRPDQITGEREATDNTADRPARPARINPQQDRPVNSESPSINESPRERRPPTAPTRPTDAEIETPAELPARPETDRPDRNERPARPERNQPPVETDRPERSVRPERQERSEPPVALPDPPARSYEPPPSRSDPAPREERPQRYEPPPRNDPPPRMIRRRATIPPA